MERKQLHVIWYFLVLALLTSLVMGMTACTSKKVAPSISSIAITPNSMTTLAIGAVQPFIAIATYTDGSTVNISYVATWVSSDTTVATIAQWGKVTGVATGSTNITVSMSGITSPVLSVRVKQLYSLTVTPNPPGYLAVGSTQQFTATGTFTDSSTADITDQVMWTNNSTIVATISTTGLATGLGGGTTFITASLSEITSPSVTLTVTSQ